MWFRNLRIYRLPANSGLSNAQLEECLARHPLARCGSMDMISRGWVYARHNGSFVHSVNRQWLLALGVEQKLLPAAVIRQAAQERASQIEAEQGRKIGRKELRDLRQRVSEELLPRAFTSRRTTWAWIDPLHGWLVVDAGSEARAEEFMEVLVATLDDFAPRSLQTQISPCTAMTDWLAAGEGPAGFTLDQDLELRSTREAQAAIRYVRHSLDGEDIKAHIAAGKIATKLAMTWKDKVSCVLTENLHLKRLAFLDILKEESEKLADNEDERFDADFALMAGELARFLDDLLAVLGGEQVHH